MMEPNVNMEPDFNMEANASNKPIIHIIPLKDKEIYQYKILEISLHKRRIRTNIQLPNQKEVKHSNKNLQLFLGSWKPFKPFAQKYDKYGIHIGFSGPQAWIYCGEDLLDREEMQSFQKDLKEIIEDINEKFDLSLNKEQELNTPGTQFGDFLFKTNPTIQLFNVIGSLWADDENDKRSYWERLKDNTDLTTVNMSTKYLFGNMVFIRDVLEDYLKENSIILTEK